MGHLAAPVLGLSLPGPEYFVFGVNTLIAVFSAMNVVLQRNPVYSALFLIANFFALAVYYLLLGAQFLAAIQIIVYAGAIMVLFLFVITLLSPGREEVGEDRLRILHVPAYVLAFLLGIGIVAALWLTSIQGTPADLSSSPACTSAKYGFGTAQCTGDQLFHNFLFPFEVTSLLLLAAMLGAVVLAKRRIN